VRPFPSIKILVTSVAAISLCACVSQPVQQQATPAAPPASSLPSWVMNPMVENGIADTQCVSAKPGVGLNYLKSQATALARAELSKQLDVKVKAMDKTYQRLADTTSGQSVGGTFESVSKQVAQQSLSGSRAINMDYVTMPGGEQNFCVMVALSPELTDSLFKELVNKSGANLSPQDEGVLYEQFLSHKAQEEMEAELMKSQ